MPSYAKTTARRAAGRSRRRLLVLVAIVATVMVAGAIAYTVRSKQIATRLAADRDLGIEAVANGEFERGLDLLGPYLERNKKDVDALVPYGRARAKVEQPGNKHLLNAIEIFRIVLEEDPANVEARRQLLSLYFKAGSNRDTIAATEGRSDPLSLQARAIALGRLGEVDDALDDVTEYAAQVPTDFRMQRYAIALLNQNGKGAEAIDRVDALEERLEARSTGLALLRVAAQQSNGDTAAAEAALRNLAVDLRGEPSRLLAEPPDVVRELVSRLDNAKLYEDAEWALLTYAAADSVAPAPDPGVLADTGADDTQHSLRGLALERLLATGRAGEAAGYAKAWVEAAPTLIRPRLAALGQLAGADVAAGEGTDWRAFADAIANSGWLDNVDASGSTLSDVAAADLLAAARRLPADAPMALAEQAAGDALSKLGELRAALGHWQQSALLAPWWAAPQRSVADALINVGRPDQAVEIVQVALERGRNDAATRRVHARAVVLDNESSDADLQQAGEELDALADGDAGELLALRALAWERAGRADRATQILTAAAEADADTSALAEAMPVARRVGGEALSAVVAALEARRDEPAAVEALAIHAARTGDAEAAADMVANLPDEPRWQRVRATIFSGLSDPQAARVWQQVADAMPDDLGVQRRALADVTRPAEGAELDAMPVSERLAFAERAAGRVTERVGAGNDLSVALPLARALLAAANGDAARIGEAAVKLQAIVDANPQYLEARLLLADAMQRTGNEDAANSQLQLAVDEAPDNLGLRLALAERLLAAGDAAEADRLLDAAARQVERDPESADGRDRRQLAQLLNRRGDAAKAIAVLDSSGNAPSDLIARARVLLRAEQLGDAEVQGLLDIGADADQAERLRVAAYEVALRHAVRQNDASLRGEIIDNLGGIAGGEGDGAVDAELILAANDTNAGRADEAAARYGRITERAPGDARAWAGLILRALGDRDAAKVAELSRTAAGQVEAAGARAAFEGVATALGDAATARAVSESGVSRSLVAAVLPDLATGQPGVDGDAARNDVLRAVALANSSDASAADGLSTLATRYPSVRPLTRAVVGQLAEARRWRDVLRVGGRAVATFPGDAELARLTALAADALGDSTQTSYYALLWADWANDPDDVRRANTLASRALLAVGDYRAVLERMRPYVEGESPSRDVLLLYSTAAAQRSDWDAVQSSLLPHMARPEVQVIVSDLAKNPSMPSATVEALTAAGMGPDSDLEQRIRTLVTRMNAARAQGNAESVEAEMLELADAASADNGRTDGATLIVAVALQLIGTDASDRRAGELYREVLQRDPNQVAAAGNLAQLLLNDRTSGTVDEGITFARRAADGQEGTDRAAALETLAGLQLKRGDARAAVATATEATELAPENGLVHLRLAEAKLAAGDTAGATDALDQARRLGPPAGTTELDAFDARRDRLASAMQ